MKPFNLEEFKSGKKAVTRGGDIAEFGGYKEDAREYYQILGWINGENYSWKSDGSYDVGHTHFDLIGMAPEKKTVWVNVWKDGEAYWYDYESLAKHGLGEADKNFIGTFPIEIEV